VPGSASAIRLPCLWRPSSPLAFSTGLDKTWETSLYRAATLLVAASPCAIVISVPAAILSALSAAAHGGVLFKGGAALETRAAVDIFAFDKTGTLTSGRVDVTEIVTLDGSETDFRTLEQHVERQMAGANVLDADRYQLVVMLDYHSARVPW